MKNLLLVVSLVLLLCFTFGCQNKAEKAELEKFRAQAALEEQNKAIMKIWEEAWNKGDFEALKKLIAPECVWYMPSGVTNTRSGEEMIEAMKLIHNGIPDSTLGAEELYAVGDRVIIRFVMRGTHQGEFQGIPATGNRFEMSGISIVRIENGKVVESREDVDTLGFMQQLGMELRPKEIKK